jgi:hypothetical protein
MAHLFWGLLNISLFLFFIFICFKATKFIRERINLIAAIIFVFGLLSFIGRSNEYDSNTSINSNQIQIWKRSLTDTLNLTNISSINIDLEETLVSRYQLLVTYGKETGSQINKPISASTSMSGFVSGTSWTPISIHISPGTRAETITYYVDGICEWRLLGAVVYSQPRRFQGSAVLK